MYDETGGGIETGPLNWGGCSPVHPKVGGGDHLRPKVAQFWVPPLSVFLAPSLRDHEMDFETLFGYCTLWFNTKTQIILIIRQNPLNNEKKYM